MINKAFILGAGLGTRLRPLTDSLPKPLVPLFHRPLVEWTLESCTRAGIQSFAINTHHCPEAWHQPLPGSDFQFDSPAPDARHHRAHWRDHPVDFFHEPELLDTGGGLRNIQSWIGNDDLLVHNGDILTTLPLDQLIDCHRQNDAPVTLALISGGPAPHIAYRDGRAHDIREMLNRTPGTHTFTGVYCVSPRFLEMIPKDQKASVIPAFLELARHDQLAAIVLDGYHWFDLGEISSYLDAHQQLHLADPIHPSATIDDRANVSHSVIGPDAHIGADARVSHSVVWPGATVAHGESLDHQVRTGSENHR